MVSRKENLKALFSNTRSRVIILFTTALLLVAVVFGVIKLTKLGSVTTQSTVSLGVTPSGIRSIPGSVDPTAQYAALQQTQNIQQANIAAKTGSSAIPTIIRTQAFGEGTESVGPQGGKGGVGFTTLAREDSTGTQQSLWLQSLKDSHCSKASVDQVVSQGAVLSDLKGACTCKQLKDYGYKLADLNQICSCKDLKASGFSVKEMKDTGYSAGQLRQCGFDACELRGAGFTAQQMKDGGFSDGELKGAGFADKDIVRAGGLPDGVTADDVRQAGCQIEALRKLRNEGVTAAAIRRISGCTVTQLKGAGFNAAEMKSAGFSAAELKNAGYTPDQLKQAGFTARDLLNAGFSPEDLSAAGFSPAELKAAEAEFPPGVTPDHVKRSGCDSNAIKRERLAGVSASLIRQYAHCSAADMKAGGFTDADLANAGFSPEELAAEKFPAEGLAVAHAKEALRTFKPVDDATIRSIGCDPKGLHALYLQEVSASRIHALNGCSAEALKNAGYGAKDLADAGFTPQQLLAAGFTPAAIRAAQPVSDNDVHAAGCDPQKLQALFKQGVSAERIRNLNGCSAQDLKDAGFDATALTDAGFTPEQLAAAGFTPDEISKAEAVNDAAVRAAGCDPSQLQKLYALHVSAKRIKDLNGCSLDALKQAGYSAMDLAEAGFTPQQLAAAGFSPDEISAIQPTSDNAIRDAGCDPQKLQSLYRQGVSATRIHALNGCSAEALKQAGFDAKELTAAGFTPSQLLAAGFTPEQIRAAEPVNDQTIKEAGCDPNALRALRLHGVTAKQIHDLNGCSAETLKSAGFDATSLTDAGFSPQQLSAAGFTPDQINKAQSVNDAAVRAAGCDPTALQTLYDKGVSAKRIHDLNGCSAEALKKAGYDAKELLQAGYTPQQLLTAGFTPDQVEAAQPINGGVIKAAGCDPKKLQALYLQGVSAKSIHDLNGCSAEALKNAGFTPAEIATAGFTPQQLAAAGISTAPTGTTSADDSTIKAAGCDPQKLHALFEKGVSAKRIRDLNGCSVEALKNAGYDAKRLADAGLTPEQLLAAGFTPDQLVQAGLSPAGVIAAGRVADCSQASLQAAHALNVSAETISQTLGCDAKALKDAGYSAQELKNAGFTAADLKNAGFGAEELKNAGFGAKELAAAGFTAQQLKDAGFNKEQLKQASFNAADLKGLGLDAKQLKGEGYTAKALKDAGYNAEALRAAGFSAKELKDAGFNAAALRAAGYSGSELRTAGYSAAELKKAGFGAADLSGAGYSKQDLLNAGFSPQDSSLAGLQGISGGSLSSTVVTIPPLVPSTGGQANAETANTKELQQILNRQQSQLSDQRSQQKIQQRTSAMLAAANQALATWKTISPQVYTAGRDDDKEGVAGVSVHENQLAEHNEMDSQNTSSNSAAQQGALIKAGDVLFAVLDTSVNSDEPGPILATIVSGKLKGTKLIGSFNRPANADKMVISFSTMSIPGVGKTISINAYAIDPNTARTALSSRTDHHYLLRYGSLFASTFLEGFGNAFQSANTTITIGGTGGMTNTTVQNGVGRSVLENAVIGLATLGKSWGQVAMQQFSLPTTVDVYSGTGLGILFTQDVRT